MSRKSQRFRNVLQPSDPSLVFGSNEVQERFINLCGTYERVMFEQLVPPVSMDADFLYWRTMALRHRSGDLRHTEAELRSLKAIAQWMVDENAKLRNQKPRKIDWEG